VPINPFVSVVLPVFNGMPYLPEALESLWQQTWPHFEVLVIDDGSTDGTARWLADCKEPRLKVVRRSHEGIVVALNAGLEQARGAFIARMDADDRCHPERFFRQVEALQARPELGLIATAARYWGEADQGQGFQHFVDWNNRLLEPRTIYLRRFVESPLIHPTVMFRKALVAHHGGYRDGDFPEDYELWLRWLAGGVRMAKLDWPGLDWRERPSRLSRADRRYATDAFYRLKTGYLADWLKTKGFANKGVVVWGAGRVSRQRAQLLVEAGIPIQAYVDIDPRKVGQVVHGRRVWSPDSLPGPGHVFVLSYVANRGAGSQIFQFLTAKGHVEGRDFLMAA